MLNEKVAICLANCIVVITMSLKSKVNVFGKLYYISVVPLCNDQNRHKVNLPIIFIEQI